MKDNENHCPFLNRTDSRCACHFSLDDLSYAFGHCFGEYERCGVYRELLAERLVRRGQEMSGATREGRQLIQVTLASRLSQGAGVAEIVSHASGV